MGLSLLFARVVFVVCDVVVVVVVIAVVELRCFYDMEGCNYTAQICITCLLVLVLSHYGTCVFIFFRTGSLTLISFLSRF